MVLTVVIMVYQRVVGESGFGVSHAIVIRCPEEIGNSSGF